MTATLPKTVREAPAKQGPGLLVPAVVTVVLFVASVVATLAFGDGLYSSPFAAQPSDIAQTYAEHSGLIKLVGLLEFASALALVTFTAAVWTRLRAAGTITDVAAIGGILAALFMALNALVQWPLSFTSVSGTPAIRHALELLYFGLGGFGHVASLGLLVGGVSLAASRLLPRWFVIAGLVLAGICVLSTLTFVVEGAAVLLPLGRFISFIWMITVSALVSRRPVS
jgi:hypothetical protein